ncbi:ankyrin-1-like [Mercenaria mercenaria]|uniref:ankyrin-1-like n=1 Tax=Mercenaria mercenaria TaxID=6596 RepID=UPI00234E9534|nr:ankyrin-1-like [Mercenaria mercenaria]
MFSKPVDALPQKCFDRNCDIDLREELAVYLSSLGLLYDSSLLLKEVFKQNLHQCINTTEFLQSTLLIASHEGLKDVIEMLLQRGATVNEDAIYFAAAKGHNGSLEYLLKNYTGNCIDYPNSINKNSPLIAASKCGAVECMQCLLRHGASINYRNKNGWSALDKAVLCRQPDSCKILLENKARVNCKAGKFKRTPLHMNADVGDENITKLLLQYGASIKVKDYRGHYPINCAAYSGENKIVDILLKADETKVTLKNCVSYGKTSVIKGASLYHLAVLKKNVDLIDIMIQNKLCPNIRDAYGRTPIYLAVYGRGDKNENAERYMKQRAELERELQIKLIKKLSGHSDVQTSEKDGYTPLDAAVHKGQIEIVKLLGPLADVNAQDKYGKTPLHTVCDQMNLDIFKILVEDLRADYCMRT